MLKQALDIINRLEAENEKQNVELVGMRGACNSYKMHYDNAQAEIERYKGVIKLLEKDVQKAKVEAVKAFVKKFEKKIKNVKFTIGQTREIKCALKQTLQETTESVNYGSSKTVE